MYASRVQNYSNNPLNKLSPKLQKMPHCYLATHKCQGPKNKEAFWCSAKLNKNEYIKYTVELFYFHNYYIRNFIINFIAHTTIILFQLIQYLLNKIYGKPECLLPWLSYKANLLIWKKKDYHAAIQTKAIILHLPKTCWGILYRR